MSSEPFALERVPWDKTVNTVLVALGVAVFVFASVILASGVRGAAGLLRRSKRTRSNPGEQLASRLATGSSVWSLTTLVVLVLALAKWKY